MLLLAATAASRLVSAMIEVRGSQSAIRRAYNFFSYFYGFTVSLFERGAIARGLAKLEIAPGDRVLEVAVGTGAAFKRLIERAGAGGFVVGVDITAGMLAATRRAAPRAPLVQADARKLPFPAASFDVAWSSYFLDLVPTGELPRVLAEFRRLLRPRGRLYLVNFSKQGEEPILWERLYVRTPTWLVPCIFGSCRPVQIEPFLRDAGFVRIEREFVPGMMSSEIVIARIA